MLADSSQKGLHFTEHFLKQFTAVGTAITQGHFLTKLVHFCSQLSRALGHSVEKSLQGKIPSQGKYRESFQNLINVFEFFCESLKITRVFMQYKASLVLLVYQSIMIIILVVTKIISIVFGTNRGKIPVSSLFHTRRSLCDKSFKLSGTGSKLAENNCD